MIILFMALVGAFTIFVQLKEYNKKIAPLKAELDKYPYEHILIRKGTIAMHCLFILFALGCIYYGLFVQYDEVNIGLGVILSVVAIGELFQINLKNKLYYRDDRFIINGQVIRAKSIKKVIPAKPKFMNFYEIHTFNGQVERVTKEVIQFTESLPNKVKA